MKYSYIIFQVIMVIIDIDNITFKFILLDTYNDLKRFVGIEYIKTYHMKRF